MNGRDRAGFLLRRGRAREDAPVRADVVDLLESEGWWQPADFLSFEGLARASWHKASELESARLPKVRARVR